MRTDGSERSPHPGRIEAYIDSFLDDQCAAGVLDQDVGGAPIERHWFCAAGCLGSEGAPGVR